MKKGFILISFIAVLEVGIFLTGSVFAADVLPDGAIKKMIVNDKGVDENGVPVTEFILDFPRGDVATSDSAVQEQGASADANLQEIRVADEKNTDKQDNPDKSFNFLKMENLRWIVSLAIIIGAGLFWLFWRKKKKKDEQQGIK